MYRKLVLQERLLKREIRSIVTTDAKLRWQQCKRGGRTPATRFSLLTIELAIRWHGGRSLTENLKYSVFLLHSSLLALSCTCTLVLALGLVELVADVQRI